jgi:hypothetical protein
MSAGAEMLRTPDLAEATTRTVAGARATLAEEAGCWNPYAFAQEQIRGLARHVFFSNGGLSVRQIVLCGAEGRGDVGGICEQVGRALAAETSDDVAVVGSSPRAVRDRNINAGDRHRDIKLRQMSIQAANNLWLVPDINLVDCGEEAPSGIWHSRLAELRREFEYSILSARSPATSSEAALMGHLADGIILVLEAHSTRRATARKIMDMFEAAQARVLGTVLSARTFPVPEWIYRRL